MRLELEVLGMLLVRLLVLLIMDREFEARVLVLVLVLGLLRLMLGMSKLRTPRKRVCAFRRKKEQKTKFSSLLDGITLKFSPGYSMI